MNREEPSSKAARALRTKGSEAEEDWMWQERVRSRALMTIGSGRMGVSALSAVVQVILSRKGISRSHLCPWGNLPDDVKILEPEGPMSLAMREFVWILEVG